MDKYIYDDKTTCIPKSTTCYQVVENNMCSSYNDTQERRYP